MKKNLVFSLVFITGYISNAQELRPFIGLGGFVHLYSFEKDLQSSPAVSLSAGAEYRPFGFFMPEIEANYMFGKFKSREDSNSIANVSDKTFSTVNFSFSPKIALGDYNDNAYIQILPKYIYSIVNAKETINSTSQLGSGATERSTSVSQHNFGLGVGIVINFDTWYSNTLAINLCYNTIRVSNSFNKLNPGTEPVDNVGVYGIEFKYYFGVKRLK
ncbi:hypothetical protein [Flavobacterium quisquiliarum]|uniref:Outer membrane protein beta-barrel domain-containing protein n=1 Tax=Flavobacterium quisquiliarum TaxID=1834436 RepID=A0ABV8W329_9FLAO|nr:hypothetical protein [Flavobacterium quisquiliarum]MBW1655122.1 hypothetical protein [Flavobacterium quisquiliarum]NWL02714.1 hypothetical protein [Flavobacterium collinsii]